MRRRCVCVGGGATDVYLVACRGDFCRGLLKHMAVSKRIGVPWYRHRHQGPASRKDVFASWSSQEKVLGATWCYSHQTVGPASEPDAESVLNRCLVCCAVHAIKHCGSDFYFPAYLPRATSCLPNWHSLAKSGIVWAIAVLLLRSAVT
jgi:hypothetical protein